MVTSDRHRRGEATGVHDASGEWSVSYSKAVELAFARGYAMGFADGLRAARKATRRGGDDNGRVADVVPLFRACPEGGRVDH